MKPKYNLHGRTYLWRKHCLSCTHLYLLFHIYYYFKVHPNKILTCKVRGKIKPSVLGIILNGGKLR